MPSEPAPSAPPSPILLRALSWPVLAVVAALPSFAAWASGKSLAWRDSSSLYGPVRGLVTDALRAGTLPLWNPYEGTGKPLFAEGIHGVLHPLSLVAAALDPGGVDLLLALHCVAAALGAYVLARELDLGREEAFLAGLAYGLCGFVLSMTGNLVFLAGAGSMPWQVAAIASAGRAARFALPVGAVATAVSIFSGDAQVAAVSALLGGALAAERGGWRGAARAAFATGLGGLAGAVQILPTLAAIELSPRAAGLGEVERLQFALSPWRLIELVVPGVFVRFEGAADPLVFRWLGGTSQAGQDMPFAASVYLGLPVLALVACAPLRERRVRVLLGAGGVLLWLALGHFAGSRQALGWVPVWGMFRYAEKMVAPLSLVLAVLAAYGARGRGGAGPSRRVLFGAAAIGAAAALGALFVARAVKGAPRGASEMLAENVGAGIPHVLLAAVALVGIATLLGASRWRTAALCGAVTAALLAAVPFAAIRMPREHCGVWPGRLRAEPSPGPRLYVPYYDALLMHPSQIGRKVPLGEAIVADDCGRSRMGLVAYNVRDRMDAFWSYGGLGSRRMEILEEKLPDVARAARHFSVTHISAVRPTLPEQYATHRSATEGGEWLARDGEYPIDLFAVPHLPWARFAPQVAVARDVDEAAAAFAVVAASERDVAVVESDGHVPAGRGVVRGVFRAAERIAVEVDALSEGLLVVNDAFWPGWVARVDGREAPILPVNVIARGVILPAGRHTVTMDYEPGELRLGFALSLMGIMLGAGIALFEERRRRRTR